MIPFFGKKEEQKEEETVKEEPRMILITPDVLTKFLEPTPMLEQIEAYLRGETLQRKGDSYVLKKTGKPLMKEEGIQEIMKVMRSRLSEIYRTAEIDNSFIAIETFNFNLNLIDLISKKAKEWELEPCYFHEVIDFLVSAFMAVLSMKLLRRFQGVQQVRPEGLI